MPRPPLTPSTALRALATAAAILAGYGVAFVLARAAWRRAMERAAADPQASQAMYAFGADVIFLAVYLAASALPTSAVQFFLLFRPLRSRPDSWLWRASVAAIPFACTGALATLGCAVDPRMFGPLMLLAMARAAVTPLVASSFIASALAAPDPRWRWRLGVAAAMESLASVYVVWRVVGMALR